MKKTILLILLACTLSMDLLSQDMLGGEISVQYLNGGIYDVQVSLYTRASIEKDRTSLNIHLTAPIYQIIPRVFDTIIAPDVRFNYYQDFYSLISFNNSTSGLFTWDMPATPEWYLFNVHIKDLNYTPADMNRLFFVNLDSSMATPTEWIDNHNYLQVYPNPTT